MSDEKNDQQVDQTADSGARFPDEVASAIFQVTYEEFIRLGRANGLTLHEIHHSWIDGLRGAAEKAMLEGGPAYCVPDLARRFNVEPTVEAVMAEGRRRMQQEAGASSRVPPVRLN